MATGDDETAEAEQDTPTATAEPVATPQASNLPPYTHTRASGLWAAVVGGLLVLVLLIVFCAENSRDVDVSFLGAHGLISLGLALLIAAVFGGLVVVCAGAVRIIELRRRSRASLALSEASTSPPRRSRRGKRS